MLLGCIADDFTGATDLAGMLVRGGMRTVQTIGIPRGQAPQADALVVSLKTRTVPPAQAISESLAALRWLQAQGARQFFFKYCSTFDSTDAGNIGPVADALLTALGSDFSIACPAFPENGRSVYRGHLFVGDLLLHESGMENHPLTPMKDPNLVRVLQRQTTRRVGLARQDAVAQGPAILRQRFAALRAEGIGLAIVDAIDNADLLCIGAACTDLTLITGGSGVAMGLPANFAAQGLLGDAARAALLPAIDGSAAVISGSCSRATQAQVQLWSLDKPMFQVDPLALAAGKPVVEQALAWAAAQGSGGPVLISATSAPEAVGRVQSQLGVAAAGALVEKALADIAQGLVTRGVRKLVVAGGETSGAVVNALGIEQLRVGPQIDPGVPWMVADGGTPDGSTLAIALKSGNFGSTDFFAKALAMLETV